MRLIAQVQLKPTPEQATALRRTTEVANAACDYVSEQAWQTQTFGQFKLQKLTYGEVRQRFDLTAQVAVQCVKKVVDAYKLDRKVQRTFRPTGAITFDDRILRYKLNKLEVSIWTTEGRQAIPFVCGERQRRLLATRQGESDLACVKGKWYLLAVCNAEALEPSDTSGGTLGIDLGIVELATDSDGTSYSGAQTKTVRRRYKRIRGLLQQCGTKSAKRHLRKLSRKQVNFTRTENHRISKQLVKTAQISGRALAVENLKGIRERANGTMNREMRWQMGNWAFAQLGGFIQYKAALAGVPVVTVEARGTSRTCSVCGHCDKANRKSQSHFCCLACGHTANADLNAARNISKRASVMVPSALRPQSSVGVGSASPCL